MDRQTKGDRNVKTTQAEICVGPADGEDFDWMDRLDDDIDVAFVGRAMTYTFPDGSRLVSAGAAWDFGVHASRLDDPETLNRHGRRLEVAWIGAGYGLTMGDAFPCG